ncbi:hypothetical protein C8R44DRAFT_632986 [Mycena epipterygia]|nr:hypothetical protein C8R44DRAFT_632986 [Mycena epipterygia]
MRKWLSGIFHNQEWERFESLMCLVFGETVLHAQISTKHAVSFQTMISPENLSSTRGTLVIRSPSLFSLNLPSSLPVYDARTVVVDFDSDLVKLAEVLPPFVGEVPFGSFVVVGYTCSVYNAAISGSSERAAHLGCNILWVIVCGIPKR